MPKLLLDKTLSDVIKVEIARSSGEETATLTVKSDVRVNRELRTRGRDLGIRTANIPESAHAFFGILKEKLAAKGLGIRDEKLVNLPKMAQGETHFSATATVDVGERRDKELRDLFNEAFSEATLRMAAARYHRAAGDWTDRKGGKAAGMEL